MPDRDREQTADRALSHAERLDVHDGLFKEASEEYTALRRRVEDLEAALAVRVGIETEFYSEGRKPPF